MKRIMCVLALCLVVMSGWAKFGFTEKNFVDTISFTYTERNQIMVPIEIGGRSYDFEFDSGASTCKVTEEMAERLFVKRLSDAKGKSALAEKRVKNLQHGVLAEMKLGNLHLNGAECVAADGDHCLFGAYMLYYHGLRYKIDLKARKLIITDRKDLFEKEVASAYKLPVKLWGMGTMLGFSLSHGVKGSAIFDTGCADMFLVSQKYFDECCHGKDSADFCRQIVYRDSSKYMDFQGKVFEMEQANMRIDELKMGDLTFRNVPVKTAQTYMGFGSRMLEYGCVVVDGKSCDVYYEPYEAENGVVTMVDEVMPLFFGLENGHIVVQGVDAKCQAYADGVRIGDYVVEVNGKPCGTAAEFGKLVGELNVVKRITVTVRTADGTNVVTELKWR